jgi:hypothetical protein
VASLRAVLKEVEETPFVQPLSLARQECLKIVGDRCFHVLKDLDNLVKKYESWDADEASLGSTQME